MFNKKNLLIIISVNRSGTNNFFDNIQNITNYNLLSYYEIFNKAFYNEAGKWDDYFKKYNSKSKLEVLKKIAYYGKGHNKNLDIDIENDKNTITAFKIFNDHITFNELIEILLDECYNVRIIFMIRNIYDIYNSLYRSLEENDWTSKRNYSLEKLDINKLLENNKIKQIYDNKTYECFLFDTLNIVKKYNVIHKLIYFNQYKNYNINNYEELIKNLFNQTQ